MKFSSIAVAALLNIQAAHGFSTSKDFFIVKSQRSPAQRYEDYTVSYASMSLTRDRLRSKYLPLFGILDEVLSDNYNLIGSSNEMQINMNDEFEIFLGDLVFSTNDPRVDIAENYERATAPEFLRWMEAKAEKSNDPEERLALRDLLGMILDIKKRHELSKMAEERKIQEQVEAEGKRLAQADADAQLGHKLSNTDVLRRAKAIDSAGASSAEDRAEVASKKKSFYEQEITPEIRMSYEDTLKQLLPPYKGGDTPDSIVRTNYEKFDAQFVKVLNERVTVNNDKDSVALLEALAMEQARRIGDATENLKSVLAMDEPMKMEGVIVKMAREGKIDESFLLLLEANETQARDAGANEPAELMKRLRYRAVEEKDKQMASKEIALIRKLLRAVDAVAREKILEDAFTPREILLVAGTVENAAKAMSGDAPEREKPMPDVPPPDFINACKAVMLNFGNLQYDDARGDLATRIKQIASEAEVVATRIYGQGMSLRDQQDRAWKDQTTSIFDLERMELEAESRGEHAPWTNPDADDTILPGFDSQGKMQIGGN